MTSPASSSPTRAKLTRSAILAAALELVDREGTEALSMRRLGKDLGVEAMSLYNHIPNKAALLDGLVEQVIAKLDPPPKDIPWQEQLRVTARDYRTVVGAHPNVVPLIAMRPFNTMTALEPLEAALQVARDAGFNDDDALHVVRTIASFATGYALAETGGFFGRHVPADTTDVIHPNELDQTTFPHLTAMLPTIARCDHDAEFEFALDAIIQGLETKLPR